MNLDLNFDNLIRHDKNIKEDADNEMIEIHTHILPAIDDGARTEEEAFGLLLEYDRQKVTDVVCTSHLPLRQLLELQHDKTYLEDYRQRLKNLQQQAFTNGIPVLLHPGHELLLVADLLTCLQKLDHESQRALCLAESTYMLVEIPPWQTEGVSFLERILFGIQLLGYMPVLAHPERHISHFGQTFPLLKRWVEQELVCLQINAASLVQKKDSGNREHLRMRGCADRLIREGLVHFAASDAHNLDHRPPRHDELYQVLKCDYGVVVADSLLQNNPAAVLADKPVYPALPE